MKQIYIFLVIVAGCFGLAGCGADPVAPVATGSIVGFAGLRDEAGTRLTDQSGITVRIKGSNRVGTSDTAGVWMLNDVAAGIYDLEISKPGFATNYLRAFQFVAGGTAYITSVIDLIRSRADTLVLAHYTYKPEYEVLYRDTLVETDTGWVRPLDTLEIPNRVIEFEGDVRFESDTQHYAPLYLRPFFNDLSVVPGTNYLIGAVHDGHQVLDISIQQFIQRGYPRGVPVTVTFTTRQNNTYYFEPSSRQRIVTDPHDLLRIVLTLPVE